MLNRLLHVSFPRILQSSMPVFFMERSTELLFHDGTGCEGDEPSVDHQRVLQNVAPACRCTYPLAQAEMCQAICV